jgi:hypothetical protein
VGNKPGITTWDQFVTAFYHNFEAYIQEDCFLAPRSMKQQGKVAYYSTEFLQVSLLVENISTRCVVAMYIDGLKESIGGYVKAMRPTTLEVAIRQTKGHSEAIGILVTGGLPSKTNPTTKGEEKGIEKWSASVT